MSSTVVRCLVRHQRPDLRDLALVRVADGWDNATFRLGDDLAVRLPRRAEAVPLILHAQRYLPDIARRSAVAVPVPVHVGLPTSDFPWPWSIVRWIPGAAAAGWLMFDAGARHRFMDAFGPAVDGYTWARARGWALVLATAMLSNSDDNPRMLAGGEFGIRQVLVG